MLPDGQEGEHHQGHHSGEDLAPGAPTAFSLTAPAPPTRAFDAGTESFEPGRVGYRAPSGKWQLMATYGYGFEAIRDTGRGAQAIGLFLEINLHANNSSPTLMDRAIGYVSGH